MPSIEIVNLDKKKVGTMELSDTVFAADVNVALLHQVLKAQLANRRQGTASTKTKGEVRGGGKKPFKQKGTGNARQGSSRSPLQPGGGATFGPRPRDYEQNTPKKMVAGALRSALSDRFKAGRVIIVDEFKVDQIKTAPLRAKLEGKLGLSKALLIDDENRNFEMSARNIPGFKVLRTGSLNVYDIVGRDWVVLSQRAATTINERLSQNVAAGDGEAAPVEKKAKKTTAAKSATQKASKGAKK